MRTLPRPSHAALLIVGMLLLAGVIAWSVMGRHVTSKAPVEPLGGEGVLARSVEGHHTTPRKSRMRVELVLEPTTVHDPSNDLILKVRIINEGPAPVRLNTLYLPFPSIVFETRDARGQPIFSGPPPVPPKDDGKKGRIVLDPGESWSNSYPAPFVIDLDPGLYELRFRATMVNGPHADDWEGLLESDWVSFRVK